MGVQSHNYHNKYDFGLSKADACADSSILTQQKF